MPPKDVKRQASELPNVSNDRANGAVADPNIIPAEDLVIMEGLGMSVGNRLKRGRYGVVYEGHFTEAFSVAKLMEAAAGATETHAKQETPTQIKTAPLLHYLFIRPEQMNGNSFTSSGTSNDDNMQPGRKFAIKFCDTELRKAYHIEDVEQRLQVRNNVDFFCNFL